MPKDDDFTLDLEGYPAGVYNLRVLEGLSGNYRERRIIKE